MRLYQAAQEKAAQALQLRKILVYPHLVHSRDEVANAFYTFLSERGWQLGQRLPWGAASSFLKNVEGRARCYQGKRQEPNIEVMAREHPFSVHSLAAVAAWAALADQTKTRRTIARA